ncbi:DUF2845 domain-containing protein [Marinobacter zhejiangensis]|uniref:DUF2845 domain-containing protein n=1 Tax=Marinobacter zhejiangensis TaxID=488535 RepID=A0A1I4SY96_9GAMM|nr:DUF2845 domain-containing protein [Marinobacter zhejiangensis]SFM69424.1 Protein of unknown function [Marinobacter zhejiangensis]
MVVMFSANRLLPLVLLLALQTWPATAAFRCGNSLVDIGDWPVEVRERCGEPDHIAVYPSAAVPGLGVTDTIEHWYYNPGPHRLIRRLEFRDGKLYREESLGYGFVTGSGERCSSGFLREGLSEYEVLSRCGEALSQRVYWRSFDAGWPGYPGAGVVVMPVKEWLYEFGRNEFRRVVVLQNGLVVEVRTDDKPR